MKKSIALLMLIIVAGCAATTHTTHAFVTMPPSISQSALDSTSDTGDFEFGAVSRR